MRQVANIKLIRENLRVVKQLCPAVPKRQLQVLRDLSRTLHLSILRGEILAINGKWYITHAGLLRIASRQRCRGIRTVLQERQCDPAAGRWVFKATVYKSHGLIGFVGHGDADPSNVSPLVRGAEMRVAETRAVNRALRKAYGIGLCSIEEIGSTPLPPEATHKPIIKREPKRPNGPNGSSNGQPCLRDRLSQLIRQHQLNPALVKLYAADYCGTPELRQASREQIESFINHLAEEAKKDREALVCRLNACRQKQEGAA